MRYSQQNKLLLWANLQKFWQKTNLKMLTLSVYNEVKTKELHMIRYIASYGFNEENHPAFKSYTNRSSKGSYLASTLIRDLKGQLQLVLTLPDTTQRPMLVGGHNARGV